MMFITRVRSDAVGRRLDAGFYNPEFVAAQNAIARFPLRTMESLRADGAPIGYGVLKPRFQVSSVRMVRIQDFNDPFVDLDSSATIDPLQMTEFSRSACVAGDLLVAIGGYPGRLGLLPPLPDGTTTVNINQHVVRVRFAAGVDRYFVTAFLMSPTGRRILARQVSGSVQAGINVEDFRLIAIPFVRADAQRYIGEKVRQSEELRERARGLDAQGAAALTHALSESAEQWVTNTGFVGVFASGGFRTRVSSNEIRGRLDPAGYHPELRAIAARASKSGTVFRPLLDLADVVTDSRPLVSSTKGVDAYVSVLHVDERGFVDMTAASAHKPESNGRACRPGDVLLSGLNPAANRIGVCGDFSGRGACSPEFTILESKASINPHYLAYALRSFVCLRQLIHLGQGTSSSRRRVDETELSNLQVPILDDADQIGQAIAIRQRCIAASQQLTRVAKVLVEHLIDGRLTEADLVAAQKALEAGDRSADREILKSLRQSDAPDAKPLIADVDALYALLDGSEGQDP